MRAATHIRHPEERARPLAAARASKGDGPLADHPSRRGHSASKTRANALEAAHLRMTGIGRRLWPLVLLAACIATNAALAQPPFVPDDWKFGKRQEANTLHYCVDTRDPDFPVARKIGAAIASALLLLPKEHVIGENLVGEDLDNLYRVFLETCDLYLGFKLIPDAYPQWVALSRAYYRVSYAVAVVDPAWKSLADVPRSQAIGATMGTTADIRLIQYL